METRWGILGAVALLATLSVALLADGADTSARAASAAAPGEFSTTWLADECVLQHPVSARVPIRASVTDPEALGRADNGDRVRVGARSVSALGEEWTSITLASGDHRGGITALVGTLAHEAMHRESYYRESPSQRRFGRDPTENELISLAYQAEVLERVGAPRLEIAWVMLQDGTHWDVDGDGAHTHNDTELQDW